MHLRYQHPRRYFSVEVLLWIETHHGLNVEWIWKQAGNWLPNMPIFIRNPMGAWVDTGINLVDLYDNAVPNPMKQEPTYQDLSSDTHDDYKTNGATVFSGDNVRQRLVTRQGQEKKAFIGLIFGDYANLTTDHCALEVENMKLRREIAQAKRVMEYYSTIPVFGMSQMAYNDVMVCFTGDVNSRLHVPTAFPPLQGPMQIINSTDQPAIDPNTVPNNIRDKSFQDLTAMGNWYNNN